MEDYDGSILEYFSAVEDASHNWALSFIREDLREEYKERMALAREKRAQAAITSYYG